LLTGKHYPSQTEIKEAIGSTNDKNKEKKIFIGKPIASCQGKGIFLITKEKDIPFDTPSVVQEYINKYQIH